MAHYVQPWKVYTGCGKLVVNMTRWMTKLLSIVVLTPSLAIDAETLDKVSHGYAPRPPALTNELNSAAFPSQELVEYFSILSAVPAASLDQVTPSETNRDLWIRKVAAWRQASNSQLATIRELIKAGESKNRLSKDTLLALKAIEERLSGANSTKSRVISDASLDLSHRITEMFLKNAKAQAKLPTNSGSSLTEPQKPEYEQWKDLSLHHREQLGSLIRLEKYLSNVGNFEEFATQLAQLKHGARSPNN